MNKLAIGAIALVAVLGIGYVAADKLADNSATEQVAKYLKDHNLEKTVTYKDVDYSLLNGTVTISSLKAGDAASGSDMTAEKIVFNKKDLDKASGKKGIDYSSAGAVREIDGVAVKTADGKVVKIDKFTVDKYEVQDEIPTNVEMRMVGMHIPADSAPNFPLKDPVINAHVAYGINVNAKTYDVRDVSFDSNGLGSFAFSTQFKNLNVDRLKTFMKAADTDKQSEMAAQFYQDLLATNLGKTVLTFNDGGFVDLTLAEQAKTKNVSKEDIRKETLAGLDAMVSSPAAKPYADIIKAGRNLIAKSGGRMIITANPPANLTLTQLGTMGFMGDTQGLFQKLNITASN
jgi:hypothetical protein